MGTYTVGMISIVVVSTIGLIYILKKNNLLSINLVAAIALSSIAVCLGIPFVFSRFNQTGLNLILSLFATILVYITTILIITVAISTFITEKKARKIWEKAINSRLIQGIKTASAKIVNLVRERRIKFNIEGFKEIDTKKVDVEATILGYCENASSVEKSEIIENELVKDAVESEKAVEIVETGMYPAGEEAANILEKSVDTEQIIDKMGLENVNDDKLETEISSENDNKVEDIVHQDDASVSELLEEPEENIEVVNVPDEYESEYDYYSQPHFVEESLTEEKIIEESDITAEDINNFIIESEQQFAATVEENSEDIHSIDLSEGIIDDIGGEELPILDGMDTENQGNISNDSISGETWTLPIEQSIDNIYSVPDLSDIGMKEDMSVNEYIDEAFRLKNSGDLESAILQYMYALDKKPEKDAVFWIVLDTCVLYKELGQAELAREILGSYVAAYGDVMSLSVRTEIERNLSNNEV